MKVLLAALLCLGLSGCVRHLNAPDESVSLLETEWTVKRNLRYSPPDWPEKLFADLYIPQNPKPRPAVLMVHGGGWERRSREDMTWIAEALAADGFVVLNINYRFAPEYRFPAQLYDLQVAMHWLHDHSEQYAIDRDRIAALGYSSGAHLVSLMALVASDGPGELDTPYGGPETRPAAVVAGGTPSDLRKFGSGKLVEQFLGGTIKTLPDVYANASPITHVTANAPPFFLFHGSMDDLVPTHHATDFQAALASKGVSTQLYIMRLRGHIATFLTSHCALEAGTRFLYRQMDVPALVDYQSR
jgi:acetyl esterase/lipase